MINYILCEECGEPQALCIGGLGTPFKPWQWECSECGYYWSSNDNEPET